MNVLIRVYKYSKLQILVVPLFYSMYIFFLFMFQSLFRISDTALYVLIKKNSMFLKTLASTFTGIPIAIHLSRKSCHLISTQHGKPFLLKMLVFNGTSAVQHAGQYIIRMNVQLDFRVVNCNRNAVHLFRFQITLKFSIENFVILF